MMNMNSIRPVGDHLREWRQRRRMSQLDLALEADISTRHLSFLETGRSQPSREMVLLLAEQLGIPLRERNVILVSAGYRVVVPYLRGYGPTRFLSDDSVRNGQQSALAVDVIALMDALGIESAIIGGFDWGARSANVVAALWPHRCKAMVSVRGYLIGNQEANKTPLRPSAELLWWYQYYFATERGRAGYDTYRREFAELIWHSASPQWNFDEVTFDRSAASFDNIDHVDIVIHN